MSKFTGVWAIFEYLDETTETIEQVREQGVQPTVLMPCPRHEIDHALGEPGTLVPWIALAFGALGCLIGFSLPAWTASGNNIHHSRWKTGFFKNFSKFQHGSRCMF